MSMTFKDSMSMFIVQTLGLQLMRREAALCTSKFLLTGGLVPFTRRLGLSSTISLSKRPLLIRLSLTRLLFLLLPESLGLNLARIRLSLKRLLLIGLISLTLAFFWEF